MSAKEIKTMETKKEIKIMKRGNAKEALEASHYLFPDQRSTASLGPDQRSTASLNLEDFKDNKCGYRVGKHIGEGSFGNLYLALPKSMKSPTKPLVVKIQNKKWSPTKGISEHQINEIIYQYYLKGNPYIAQIYDADINCIINEVGKPNNQYIAIFMPKAVSDLYDLLYRNDRWNFSSSNPFAPGIKSLRFKLARDIVCGINYMHKNHILHLDLKPSNILLFFENDLSDGPTTSSVKGASTDGPATPTTGSSIYGPTTPATGASTYGPNKGASNYGLVAAISDFGLSQNKDGEEISSPNSIATVTYRDPRLLCELDEKYNQSVDIWSLGLILMEIFFGFEMFEELLSKTSKSESKSSGKSSGGEKENDEKLLTEIIFNILLPSKSTTDFESVLEYTYEHNPSEMAKWCHEVSKNVKELKHVPLPSIDAILPDRDFFSVRYYTPEEYKDIWQVINSILTLDRDGRPSAEQILRMPLFSRGVSLCSGSSSSSSIPHGYTSSSIPHGYTSSSSRSTFPPSIKSPTSLRSTTMLVQEPEICSMPSCFYTESKERDFIGSRRLVGDINKDDNYIITTLDNIPDAPEDVKNLTLFLIDKLKHTSLWPLRSAKSSTTTKTETKSDMLKRLQLIQLITYGTFQRASKFYNYSYDFKDLGLSDSLLGIITSYEDKTYDLLGFDVMNGYYEVPPTFPLRPPPPLP